jgi:hypothetical protein
MSYLIRASFTKAHSEALMQKVCVRTEFAVRTWFVGKETGSNQGRRIG